MKRKILLRLLFGILLLVFISGLALTRDAHADPPIKIGVPSEWDYPAGQGVKRGVEMAVRELNAKGGLLGRKVEGIYYDNKADPNEAKNATERLLYKDKVDVICGFWRSDLAIVAQPLIMEAKKILLIGGAGTPVVTADRIKKNYSTYKYTFTTTSHVLALSSEQGVTEALKLGMGKIALMAEKAAWCDPWFDFWNKKYSDKIVYTSRFSPTATDFSVEFAQVKASGADIVFFISSGRGGTPGVKQWYDMQIPAVFVGYNLDAQDPNFAKITEGKCEGVAASKVGGVTGLAITKKSLPFYNEYKKIYGELPIAYTNGVAYDAVMAWAHAVKMAGTVESEAVVKAMERKDFNYEGVCGVIEYFDDVHNPVGGGWAKGEPWGWIGLQWQKNKQVIFWPKNISTGKFYIPERITKLRNK
jgi:branched-chain amino acid transport system substrate-binding protein